MYNSHCCGRHDYHIRKVRESDCGIAVGLLYTGGKETESRYNETFDTFYFRKETISELNQAFTQ